jgi:pilus assembly protein Flp/PilA
MSSRTFNAVANFLKQDDGPTAVEYAILLALIIVVCAATITVLGTNTNKSYTRSSNAVGSIAS